MTAAQELIKKIKVRIPFFQYSVYQDDFNMAIEREKEQITDAYNFAITESEYVEGEEYYKQKYNLCPIHNEALNEDGLCNTCLENSNK